MDATLYLRAGSRVAPFVYLLMEHNSYSILFYLFTLPYSIYLLPCKVSRILSRSGKIRLRYLSSLNVSTKISYSLDAARSEVGVGGMFYVYRLS